MKSVKHLDFWLIVESILLGFIANLLINLFFNPGNPKDWWSIPELIIAILFCIPITFSNRVIENKLEAKFNWTTDTGKRFFYQLLYLTIIVLITVNVIGRIYHWIIEEPFYTNSEILIINLVVFIMTLLLVIFKWALHFYKKWKISEVNLKETNLKFEELRYKSRRSNKSLRLQKRNSDYIISVEEVRLVKSEFGVVRVYMKNGDSFFFKDTLSKIASLLPEDRFFQLTRNMIAHYTQIVSIESATYGKVLVRLKDVSFEENEIFVSRLKASAFRKWYNSISSSNL